MTSNRINQIIEMLAYASGSIEVKINKFHNVTKVILDDGELLSGLSSRLDDIGIENQINGNVMIARV